MARGAQVLQDRLAEQEAKWREREGNEKARAIRVRALDSLLGHLDREIHHLESVQRYWGEDEDSMVGDSSLARVAGLPPARDPPAPPPFS